jgi:hypothetical protein
MNAYISRRSAVRHFTICLFGALACGRAEPTVAFDDPAPTALATELRGKILLVNSVDSPAWAKDPLTITSVAIDGDTLSMTVSYGGGCRRHALQPIAETVWMESWPVQVAARIAHNADGDLCRALVTRFLKIDLSPLRDLYRQSYQSVHGKIRLNFPSVAYGPVYEF